MLSFHLNFRKSGWVLDFSTCPGLYGVKCNAAHFRWRAEKTERRDELVSASCLFPFLPTAIVLNLEKKKFTGREIVLALEIKTASAAWLRRASGSWGKLFLSYP